MQISTNQGYDVWGGVIQGTPPRWNGLLYYKSDSSAYQPLWVYEVKTGFSLSGTTAQSRSVRSFFPHNRVQQSVIVSCQCPNQLVYGQTVEWIRESQKKLSTSVQLTIFSKNMPVKGLGSPIHAEGYIKNVSRRHVRFEYAPELEFEFLVERVFSESSSDRGVKMRILNSWKDIIESQKKDGAFRIDPDEQTPSMPPITPVPEF